MAFLWTSNIKLLRLTQAQYNENNVPGYFPMSEETLQRPDKVSLTLTEQWC